MNIAVVRAFITLKQLAIEHKALTVAEGCKSEQSVYTRFVKAKYKAKPCS